MAVEIGCVYRFAGNYPHREFGEWEVTRIENGVALAIPMKGLHKGREMSMCSINDDTDLVDSDYRPILVRRPGPDRIEQLFE